MQLFCVLKSIAKLGHVISGHNLSTFFKCQTLSQHISMLLSQTWQQLKIWGLSLNHHAYFLLQCPWVFIFINFYVYLSSFLNTCPSLLAHHIQMSLFWYCTVKIVFLLCIHHSMLNHFLFTKIYTLRLKWSMEAGKVSGISFL